CMQGTQLPYTC
nr:immunoglobulin light chain junction region [Macaca mulatta]MOW74578.1 immunoglobulin light chain junction region [Macaca mulatta]